jgi:ABC-type spermidine/putrescine transport system permease subunit I
MTSLAEDRGAPQRTAPRLPLSWLGLAPFVIFAVLFLLLPTMYIVLGAFRTPDGGFTLGNIANLFTPSILSAYWISIRISVASALLGCLIGFAIAARSSPSRAWPRTSPACRSPSPSWPRSAVSGSSPCSCANGSASTSTRWDSTS